MYVFLLIDTMVLKIVIYFVKSLAQRKMGKNEFTRENESLQTFGFRGVLLHFGTTDKSMMSLVMHYAHMWKVP